MATKQKLIVEVVDARNLLPKDGHGSSSPYVVIDFYGQRKRTKSAIRDLNPTWNETLEFNVGKPSNVFGDMLELDVYHDKNYGPTRRINHLGRIRLSSSQFVRKGEEALIYYPLEKKYLFSWTQGEIGLRIYYQDEVTPPPPQPAAAQEEEAKADTNQESSPPQPTAEAAAPAESEAIKPAEAQKSDVETGATTESNKEQPAEEAKSNEEPPAQAEAAASPPPPSDNAPAPIQVDKPPESDVAPSPPPQGPVCQNKEDPSPSSAAVNEPAQEDGDGIVFEAAFSKWGPAPPGPFPEIKVSGINAPQPIIRPVAPTSNYTLEPQESISIERSAFDLVEKMHYLFVRVVKARHLPTSGNPVVRIEVSNSRVQSKPARKTSCFEWDQTFAFGRDAPDSSSIVEISVWDPHDPKSSEMAAAANFLGGICFDVTEIPLRDPPDSPLAPQWYRLEGGGAYRSDLMLATWVGTQADDSFPDAWKTDTAGNINSRAKVYLSPKLWYLRATVLEAQDIFPLMPLRETAVQVKAQLESRQPKGPVSIGMVRIPLSAIERRVDDRKVASRWFSLEDPRSEKAGYRDGKGCTDAYCVAKYGPKWVRTRTVCDSLDPKWNEQYTWKPLLPLMHHLKPLGVVQQELLRNTAVKIIATHLSRSEPALRREVVSYMLDVDTHAFSMRKIRANWIRIINVIASVIDIVRWIDDTRVWKNPTSTILVHALLIMLVWFPDLIVPTLAFYVFVIGVWNYRFRSRAPLPHFDPKLSLADTADRDELDEEFDPLPSSRPPEMVRTRYDKLRMLGARVQTVLGDFATQGERLQALVTWRDPRATGIFVGLCFVVAMILYMVPSKMVAMASGFYFFRHPISRDRMPSPALNFFRRLPSLSDRIMTACSECVAQVYGPQTMGSGHKNGPFEVPFYAISHFHI
ncbi:hypothetical protein D5086_024404 [Populus alba]|uniref:Uncharacterized protein n=1 Tax=Populus alba TaxID=43335 RepID=A0ACC4B622_POPAL